MSKNFERAYREAAQMEAPDLWDRIEAGLKDKSVPEEETRKITAIKETESSASEKKPSVFKRYSGVLAAAVCAAVILPAAVLLRQNVKDYSSTDTTEGIEETAEESVEESAADTEAGTGMAMPMDAGSGIDTVAGTDGGGVDDSAAGPDGGGADDSAAAEDAGAEDNMAAAESAMEKKNGEAEKAMEDVSDKMAADREMSVEKMQEYESGKASRAADAEGDVFERVSVKVTEINDYFCEEGEAEPGGLYTVNLQQSVSGISEGEQITIYVPAGFQASFHRDEVFEADLEYRGEADYSYIVTKIY